MKLRLFTLLALSALLLSACSPRGEGGVSSAGQSGTQSSQSSSDPFQPGSSSQEQPQTIPALCTADWLIEYQKELQALGCSLDQVSAHYDMLSYDWWPSGREEVRSDERVLLFSDSPHKAGAVWDPVMTAAASLGQTQPPQGYTQSADAQLADSLMTGWGVKNPETGGQLFAALEGEAFEAAALPASAVLGDALPAGTDQTISALNTAFSFSQFGESGYWFYLGSYKVFLPADSQGQVAADAVFLIRWADNAEI